MEEKEVKFLEIDVPAVEKKLMALGAKKVFTILYKRKVFDYPDLRLDKQAAWVRLRDEGDKITLTYKQRLGVGETKHGDKSMEEIEVNVDDFIKTALLLERLGMKEKFYEENMRIRYTLNEVHFDIDTWPLLPPYLEIEADNWEAVDEGINALGLNPEDKKICSTHQVYKMYGYNEND
jgi:adenylate cyclase class 2